VERNGVQVEGDLLREGVREAPEPAHGHPHRQVLPLDVPRGNHVHVGVPMTRFLEQPTHTGLL
jgi:hypothetical protein